MLQEMLGCLDGLNSRIKLAQTLEEDLGLIKGLGLSPVSALSTTLADLCNTAVDEQKQDASLKVRGFFNHIRAALAQLLAIGAVAEVHKKLMDLDERAMRATEKDGTALHFMFAFSW
jgi:hypothetical protein